MMHYITSHHIVSRRIASHRVATRDLLRTHTHTHADHAESARADHPRDHLAWEPAREHGAWFTSRSVDRSIAPSHPFFAPLLSRLSSRLSSLASALLPRSCCAHAALVAAAWFLSRCCALARASAEQVFKGYSVQTLTESTSFVQDLKLGHYIKVPPRATFVGASSSLSIRRAGACDRGCSPARVCALCICFFLWFFWVGFGLVLVGYPVAVQLVATILAAFLQVGVKVWMFDNVPDMCSPDQESQLVCPHNQVYFTASVIWCVPASSLSPRQRARERVCSPAASFLLRRRGLIGPSRQFGEHSIYYPQLYAIIAGAILPIPFWLWQRRYPDSWTKFISTPIILNGVAYIPPATGINYSSWFAVGFVFQFLIRKRNFAWWCKFNYITSAALDGGAWSGSFFSRSLSRGGACAGGVGARR